MALVGTRLTAYSCGGSSLALLDPVRFPVSALAGHRRLDPD